MLGIQTGTVAVGEGIYALEAHLCVTANGMTVTACSPAHAHLGATAQAIPRPEPGRTATVSLLAVPCHRDEQPAHDIAAALATRFLVPVAASAGLHIDHATPEQIQRLLAQVDALIEQLVALAEQLRRASWQDEAQVVACDDVGRPLRAVSRAEAHAGMGIRHQGFSVYLVEPGPEPALVLCRRAPDKRLWGGVLADSCAGHPEPGQSLEEAARQRVAEELGVTVAQLMPATAFVYQEDHGDGHAENEWCQVFVGRLEPDASLAVNPHEVSEVRRVRPQDVESYLEGRPEALAPWARLALSDSRVRATICDY